MNPLLNKFSLSLIILFLLTPEIYAQELGNMQSGLNTDGNIIDVSYQNADVRLEICQDNMIRVRTTWNKGFEENEPYMVVKYQWPKIEYSIDKYSEYYSIKTDKLELRLKKGDFDLKIYDIKGNLLTEDVLHSKANEQVKSIHSLQPDEHFFGFGERMDFLDRRGKKVELNVGRGEQRPHIIGAYNVLEANYCPVPFFMSTKGYGIFFHNSYATEWDMGNGNPDEYSFSADGGELDYYFIYGPKFANILDGYTDITGKSPMMNRFAFGLHVGTYSGGTWGHEELTSTQYVINLARKFRELGIPLDILHLDSTWRIFGDTGGKGATTFEWRETFVDPEAMFDTLYQLDLNMVGVHLRPRFDNGNKLKLLTAAREKGFVYPEDDNPGEFVNFFDEEAVDWWWENGVMRVAEQGAMFLKTDEGSAFGRKANESDKIGPTGQEIQRLHNIFPLAYAKAPYGKFAEYNGLRGMNHTREGYAGIQRYPFIFAGDWPSEWQYFEPVIKAGLNIGISGVGYWAHCMGGFEHEADPELYIRWCQFGLLSPVAHLFGMDHPAYKEPWNYGEEGLRIFRQYDELRYRLIPFMYSNAWEMNQTGMPLMRALVLEYQDDVNTYGITDQYLLGSSMLVCPVTTKGAKTRSLYLPEGTWYSHWDGKSYEGKQYVHVVTPLDQMPIFYKEGSIVPTQPVVQYVDKEPVKEITLHIYPGAGGSFDLYDDDGRSLEYQDGEYALTRINYSESEDGSKVEILPAKGGFELPERTYIIQVHAMERPSELTGLLGKKKLKLSESTTLENENEWGYDEGGQILTAKVKKGKDEKVTVEWR